MKSALKTLLLVIGIAALLGAAKGLQPLLPALRLLFHPVVLLALLAVVVGLLVRRGLFRAVGNRSPRS